MNPYAFAPIPEELTMAKAPALEHTSMRMGQAILTRAVTVSLGLPVPMRVAELMRRRQADRTDKVSRVKRALEDRRWDFRSVPSLAETTGLPESLVRKALVVPGVARRPWGRSAVDLYARADKKVSLREVVSLLRVFLAKRA